MARVTVSIPKLGVTRKGREKSKEIYVLGLACDLAGSSSDESEIISALENSSLDLLHSLAAQDEMKWIISSVSPVFKRIQHDQPVSLTGNGIVLYRHRDPKGFLSLHFFVIECDQEFRNIGKLFRKVFTQKSARDSVKKLSVGINPKLIEGLVGTLTTIVAGVIKRNGDTVLLSHLHSGSIRDNYGLNDGSNRQDFSLQNNRAYCTLRVQVDQ